MPLSSTSFFKEAVLPAEGTVSTAEPRALVFFLGRLVWQRASKWACMGASMDRKLHCRKPLSVVAAISRTCQTQALVTWMAIMRHLVATYQKGSCQQSWIWFARQRSGSSPPPHWYNLRKTFPNTIYHTVTDGGSAHGYVWSSYC